MKAFTKAQICLAKHKAMVVFIREDHEVPDQRKKNEIPFVPGDVVAEGDEVPIGRIELIGRGVFDISDPEIPKLVWPDLVKADFPLAEVFLVILDDGLVVPAVLVILFPKPFLELGTGEQTAKELMVPAAVDVAVELFDVRRLAGPEDVFQCGPVGLGKRFVSPFGCHTCDVQLNLALSMVENNGKNTLFWNPAYHFSGMARWEEAP